MTAYSLNLRQITKAHYRRRWRTAKGWEYEHDKPHAYHKKEQQPGVTTHHAPSMQPMPGWSNCLASCLCVEERDLTTHPFVAEHLDKIEHVYNTYGLVTKPSIHSPNPLATDVYDGAMEEMHALSSVFDIQASVGGKDIGIIFDNSSSGNNFRGEIEGSFLTEANAIRLTPRSEGSEGPTLAHEIFHALDYNAHAGGHLSASSEAPLSFQQLYDAARMDLQDSLEIRAQGDKDYWLSPQEVLARAFEGYVSFRSIDSRKKYRKRKASTGLDTIDYSGEFYHKNAELIHEVGQVLGVKFKSGHKERAKVMAQAEGDYSLGALRGSIRKIRRFFRGDVSKGLEHIEPLYEIFKARGTKYLSKKRKGKRWVYVYPTKGKGRHHAEHKVAKKKLAVKDADIHAGASFSAGAGEGHLVITKVEGSKVTFHHDDIDGKGTKGQSVTLSKGQFQSLAEGAHKEAAIRHAQEGLERRESLVKLAEERDPSGTAPATVRAKKELKRWKDAHPGLAKKKEPEPVETPPEAEKPAPAPVQEDAAPTTPTPPTGERKASPEKKKRIRESLGGMKERVKGELAKGKGKAAVVAGKVAQRLGAAMQRIKQKKGLPEDFDSLPEAEQKKIKRAKAVKDLGKEITKILLEMKWGLIAPPVVAALGVTGGPAVVATSLAFILAVKLAVKVGDKAITLGAEKLGDKGEKLIKKGEEAVKKVGSVKKALDTEEATLPPELDEWIDAMFDLDSEEIEDIAHFFKDDGTIEEEKVEEYFINKGLESIEAT